MGRDEGTSEDESSDSDIDWSMKSELVVERVMDSQDRLWRQKAEDELPMALSARVASVVERSRSTSGRRRRLRKWNWK
jgi:hypothetical protein